jgi:hypothetical protein
MPTYTSSLVNAVRNSVTATHDVVRHVNLRVTVQRVPCFETGKTLATS